MTTAAAEAHEHVGPYRVIRAIGAGGSARIDLARIDRAYGFQRHVVLKRPLEHLRGNAKVAASLRREARIGGRLRHPNLVAILDAGVHDHYDYLVLEYVHGASLRTVMQADAPGAVRELPLAVALAIVSDVARGMHEAHELTDDHGAPLGLVHRDVSPGNILLGLDGTVKLADFGIAKETRVSTLSGSLHGTVTYMAPEQCQGHAFDRRADVFSLGVILYELVTGARLFWADNDVASLHRVLSGAVPRPRELKPGLPDALEAIVLTAVAHTAGERYPTALALADALEGYAAGAGEVLGARWIARAMEDVVGPRPVPWIAAATVPDAAPRSDGSLVDLIALIAAAEPDEPVAPAFGDAGAELDPAPPGSIAGPGGSTSPAPTAPTTPTTPTAPTAALDAGDRAPAPGVPRTPDATARRAPGGLEGRARPERPEDAPRPSIEPAPRRKRRILAGVIALGVIGGSAITALGVMTHRQDTPARPAPPRAAVAVPATAAPVTPRPTGPATVPPDRVAPPTLGSGSPAVDADPGTTASAPVAPKKRHPPGVRRPPHTTPEARAGDPPVSHEPVPVPAPTPGPGSAQPAATPPVNVEWKSTLLLPTDGSAARPPR